MQLYRFSPIKNRQGLLVAITYVHTACHELCKNTFGTFLPVLGDVGVFCHYDEEFLLLTNLRKELTDESQNIDNKYFKLHEPIVIPETYGVPGATYNYLYIRKPDPYRSQVGDIDFYLEPEKYQSLKDEVNNGRVKSARGFERAVPDMIELFNPDIDVLAYVRPEML